MADDGLEHARLQELVAALADGELPGNEEEAVQEHLRGCAHCVRELVLHQGLSEALAHEPAPRPSASLRRRIDRLGRPAPRRTLQPGSMRWAATGAVALALICIAVEVTHRSHAGQATRPIAETPLLRDALADCRRATGRNFPRKADLQAVGDGLQFPIRPLDRPGLELFSTWKTTLAGAPAAGLAYRWRGTIVVQYAVPSELLRQQPGVDEALRGEGFYAATESGQKVLAVLADGSGTLLVADASSEDLKRLVL